MKIMFCATCNKDLADCTCPDIDERLERLYQNPSTRPAAAMNILGRQARQSGKRIVALQAKNKRLRSALETLAQVEWDEWEEDDLSATAFKFVMLSQAGFPDDEMDLESDAVKKAFPDGIPGIGEYIKTALLEEGGE